MQRFEKYSGYKDSGVAWVGEIPAGWEVKRLKYLVERISNGTTSEQLQNVEENDPTVVPVTRIETISHESVNFNKVGWVKYKSILKSFKLNKGDILFSHINSLEMVGKTAIYLDNRELYSGMNLLRIQPKSRIDYYWFHYYLKSNSSRQFFTSRAKPSINQASLPTTTVYNYHIATPSLKEQTAIANFLDEKTTKIDTAITQKEQMISLLKERKQILIQNAVTKGIDSAAKMKDSGVDWVGEIPEHWEVKRFKNLFLQSNLAPLKTDGVVTSYRDGQVTLRSNRRMGGYTEAILEHGYQGVRKGQLVLNSMDAFAGAIGVSESDGKCTPEYVVCDAIESSISPEYFSYLLREMALARYIQVICNAVRQRAIRIRFSKLSRLFFIVPSLQEQTTIVDFIKAESAKINTSITLQQQQITKLKEYKSILIDHAVTGKIKVA